MGSGFLVRAFAFLIDYFWFLFLVYLPCLSLLLGLFCPFGGASCDLLLNAIKRRPSSQSILTNPKVYLSSTAHLSPLDGCITLIPLILSLCALQKIIRMVLVLKPPMTLITVHFLLAAAVLQRIYGLVLVPEGTVPHFVLEAYRVPAVVVEIMSVIAVGTFMAGS